jgi:hypothetical protein
MTDLVALYNLALPLIFAGMAALGLAIYLGTKFFHEK